MLLNMRDVLEVRAANASVTITQGGSGDISLDKAELVAIFIEALIYGVEALTFVATVYLLHGAKRTKSLFIKFGSVILMFLLNTIHIGSSLRRILNAFVGTAGDPIPDAVGYLSDLAGFLYRFQHILIVIQTIMLDVVVIYRCYMIWDKKIWVVLLPACGIIAYLVTGIAAIHAFAVYTNDTLFTGTTGTWVTATLCVTLFTKLPHAVPFPSDPIVPSPVTVLYGTLVPRPMSAWHATYLKVNRHARLFKASLIAIESGGLAVIGAIILVPVYLAGRNAQSVLWAAMSPLTGEAFLLIVAAALLGLTPSASGASRRRKNTIPATRVTIPTIPVSPISSPTSRFSTTGSFFKSSSPSTASPSTPSDYSKTSLPFSGPGKLPSEPTIAYPNSRYSRTYGRSEPLPFTTAFVTHDISEDSSREVSIRDALAYGDGEDFRPDASARSLHHRSGLDDAPDGTFHLARSANGDVEVLQKVHVAP